MYVSHQARGFGEKRPLDPSSRPEPGPNPKTRVSVDFSRHADQRLGRVIAVWLLMVITNYSGDEAHRGKGIGTCVWFFIAHEYHVRAFSLQLDEGVTNRITCCLHLVVIIRALMTGEELIEMKNKLRCVPATPVQSVKYSLCDLKQRGALKRLRPNLYTKVIIVVSVFCYMCPCEFFFFFSLELVREVISSFVCKMHSRRSQRNILLL